MRKPNKILSVFLAVLLLISAMSVTAFAADGGSTTLTASIPCTVSLDVGPHGMVTAEGTDYTGVTSFTAAPGAVIVYTFTPDVLFAVSQVLYNGDDVTAQISGK